MIQAHSASLVYDDHGKSVFACQEINLEIFKHEFVGILGPSGSGKSSLLYLLSGLKTATSGSVSYQGSSYAQQSDSARSQLRLSEFGFVFQQSFLLGYLSALENVLVAGASDLERVESLLESLGIADKRHRYPHELSGGEKQRFCVARALVRSPKVIFADEPTAALDHANGVQVVELLRQLRGEGALVMVTHDETMLQNADRIIHIAEGNLVEDRPFDGTLREIPASP